MTYADDLKHPLWQRRRLEVLQRADFVCQRCGAHDRQLHAHHKVYVRGRRLWDYLDDQLECLCEDCHTLAHEQKTKLDLLIAQHPTAALPAINRLMNRLGAVMTAADSRLRVDAQNALQDEIDAIQDYERGAGSIATQPLEATA